MKAINNMNNIIFNKKVNQQQVVQKQIIFNKIYFIKKIHLIYIIIKF
jgi:hypothetical protein